MTTVTAMRSLETIEKDWLRKKTPNFDVGDTVDVHVKIIEGDRERIQIFAGIVIAKRHQGLSETFTVRRMVQGEGVERIFPLHSPRVADIVVKKKGQVRRAKLHYLRERVGRGTRVEEKLGGVVEKQAPAPKAPVEKPAEPKAPEAKAPEAKAPAK
jgi:large subunit ribosomal protein L19